MISVHELQEFAYVYKEGADSAPLFLLHGTGGDEHDLVQLGAYIDPSAPLVSPRGRAPEGSVNRWFARHSPGVLDTDDIVRRAKELARFVPAVAATHGLDRPFCAVGFSNGANMAAALLLLHPGLLTGAILLRPMLPLRPQVFPDLAGIPVYIAAGTQDTMIPGDSTRELMALLTESGAAVEVAWADTGHRFSLEEIDAARVWFSRQRLSDSTG